jgi:chaperonin cofactor prefoldin
MEKTVNGLDKTINTLIMDNRKLEQQLAKLKQMILINTFVDWNSSDISAREEFQELYKLIEEVI